MAGTQLRLSQFGPAIRWLMARDVSSPRLAALFGTTPENIRVIAFRANVPHDLEADTTRLAEKPNESVAAAVGIRTALDDAAWTPSRSRRLETLRREIEDISQKYSATYDYLVGARRLRLLLPRIGYAGDARRIALAGSVHQHMAWFLAHCGRSASALHEAARARKLWRVAWHESGDHHYAQGYIRSALIGSQAWLLRRRPENALGLIDLADQAAKSIPGVPGSDHHRQRGVALLQLRQDAEAASQFQKSALMMEQLDEATFPAQLLMTGPRHVSILGTSDPEVGKNVLAAVHPAFGDQSLETVMAVHWAAASCFCTDSDICISDGLDMLAEHSVLPSQFGHQATIRKLLSITPQLGFDVRLRRAWVRRALYENAFQSS